MRSRNWCVTTWKEPIIDTTEATYYVWKPEICPETGKKHWHVYIEFTEKKVLSGVKKVFNDSQIHCEPRKGTQEQAIAYVLKEETKAGDPVSWGTKKKQGKRSDIEEIVQDIEYGATMREILRDHRGNALRMIHCIEKAMMIENGFSSLDQYILLKRKEKEGKLDRLDEKILDELESKLLKKG